MEIFVKERFESAHRLPHAGPGHKCERLHGHSFRMSVACRGSVGLEKGWVVDFAEVKRVVRHRVTDRLDHNYLNEIKGLENPTSENIARWAWGELVGELRPLGVELVRVTVRETCTSGATYRGDA